MFITIEKQSEINIETKTREERTLRTPMVVGRLAAQSSFFNGLHGKTHSSPKSCGKDDLVCGW